MVSDTYNPANCHRQDVSMNAINGIKNCRSRRLYINSAYVPAHLFINSKIKSARVPRREIIRDFGMFGRTVNDKIRDILYRL
jgi:hypothetical protein